MIFGQLLEAELAIKCNGTFKAGIALQKYRMRTTCSGLVDNLTAQSHADSKTARVGRHSKLGKLIIVTARTIHRTQGTHTNRPSLIDSNKYAASSCQYILIRIIEHLDIVRLELPVGLYPIPIEFAECIMVFIDLLHNIHFGTFSPGLDLFHTFIHGFGTKKPFPIAYGSPQVVAALG